MILLLLGIAFSLGAVTQVNYSTQIKNFPAACVNQFARQIAATPGCASVSLTADVTGTLPLGNGGTNGTTAPTARSSLGINYVLQWNSIAPFSPLAGTNYFWPPATNNQAINNTQEYTTQIVVPQAGTITSFSYCMAPTGNTAASAGSVTFTLRLNAVNTAITGTQSWSGITTSVVCTTATGSVAVALGDLLSVNTLTPAWTTAPASVRTYATAVVNY